jgi:predicted porin
MNNFKIAAAAALVAAAAAMPATAAVTVFDKDETTVSIDASFNTFLVQTSTEGAGNDRDQSRVKQGFLPNWVGFNFGKQVGDLKLGGRASFWVSTNSSNTDATNSLIDTRQFYGTIDADWGQILIGKDFTLFNRNNIFLDEILIGFGLTADGLGLIDGNNVSFGNIGAGYIYPLPTSQIRYTSPVSGGFKLEAALIDPSNTTGNTVAAVADDPATVADETVAGNVRGEESTPRLEAQLTYSSGAFTGWLGALHQKSDNVQSVESEGISYGVKVKSGGFGVHVSGYDGEGLGLLIGPADASALGLNGFVFSAGDEVDSSGLLTQVSYAAGKNRFVLSRGESELETNGAVTVELENQTVALFHSVNSVLTIAAEYSKTEFNTEEVDTVAVGAVINF